MNARATAAAAAWQGVVRDVRIQGDTVTKRATSGKEKLLREVAFIAALPAGPGRCFPKIKAVREGDGWAEYDMEYCPWPNFADRLLYNGMPQEEAERHTLGILDFVFRAFYLGHHSPAPARFFSECFIGKYRARAYAARGLSKRFDALTAADSLWVNGKLCRSAEALLSQLKEDTSLLAKLQPPSVGLFHGDFKYDNFLVEPATGHFLLLDPRGSTATGSLHSDWLEDMAKLRTSTWALYDVIRAGGAEVSRAAHRIDWRWRPSFAQAQKTLAELDELLLRWLAARAAQLGDVHWETRLHFLLPLLLLANAPFQLAPVTPHTEEVAMLLHAEGLSLLEEALSRHGRG
jgi:hypothetical protein